MAPRAQDVIPKRIVILAARAPRGAAAQRLIAYKLGHGWQWALDAGWDVEIWGIRPRNEEQPPGPFRVRGPRLPRLPPPVLAIALNVVHCFLVLRHPRAGLLAGTGGWGTFGAAVAVRVTGRRSPLIIKINVHSAGDGLRRRGRRAGAQLLLEMERFVFRTADLVMTVGHSTTRFARQLGVPDDRILQGAALTTGHSAGETSSLASQSTEGARDPMLILCAARLEPRKAVDVLLRAFALVHAQLPDARVEIAGQGALRPELEALAHGLGVHEWVTFRGGVRAGDMPAFYERGSVFVLPSRADEGLPKVVVEAALAGCAVIGTTVRGTTELITPGVSGELVPPDDPDALAAAIAALLADPARVARLAARGREVALAHQARHADAHAAFKQRVLALQAGRVGAVR